MDETLSPDEEKARRLLLKLVDATDPHDPYCGATTYIIGYSVIHNLLQDQETVKIETLSDDGFAFPIDLSYKILGDNPGDCSRETVVDLFRKSHHGSPHPIRGQAWARDLARRGASIRREIAFPDGHSTIQTSQVVGYTKDVYRLPTNPETEIVLTSLMVKDHQDDKQIWIQEVLFTTFIQVLS